MRSLELDARARRCARDELGEEVVGPDGLARDRPRRHALAGLLIVRRRRRRVLEARAALEAIVRRVELGPGGGGWPCACDGSVRHGSTPACGQRAALALDSEAIACVAPSKDDLVSIVGAKRGSGGGDEARASSYRCPLMMTKAGGSSGCGVGGVATMALRRWCSLETLGGGGGSESRMSSS